MKIRARRLRANSAIRELTEENHLKASDLIYPVFIKDSIKSPETIASMPDIYRHSIDSLLTELEPLHEKGLRAIALFPVIEEALKNHSAEESYNPEALTQRTIRRLKQEFPELLIVSDIALDPYTHHGHDGILKDGKIVNDETVEILCKMALAQAEAGSDIVAPSDMMDGRVGAIREALERNNYQDTLIMSYTAKYATCLYGPFRDALGSLGAKELVTTIGHPERSEGSNAIANTDPLDSSSTTSPLNDIIPSDKKTYQMNPANSKEALKELELDIAEGADIVMVKPASWYLDIIHQFKENTNLPVAAYQVSGEYSMIHAAAEKGYLDLDQAMIESLTSIKRAGANMILSYFAKDFITNLN